MPIEDVKPRKKRKKWKIFFIILFIIALIALVVGLLVRVKKIEAGYVGIKSTLSNPFDNSSQSIVSVVNSGYMIYMPWCTDITTYSVTVQTASYNGMNISTNDGIEFIVKPRISYQLDKDRSDLLYNNFKVSFEQLNNGYLKEIVAGAYSSAAINFDSDSLIHHTDQFEEVANKLLASKMVMAGLTLVNANPNLEIPQKIKDLVDERSMAKHNMLLAEDQLKEEYAKANVQRVKDSLINSALTPLAIQKMFIEKWDGRLSTNVSEPKAYKDINQSEATPEQ